MEYLQISGDTVSPIVILLKEGLFMFYQQIKYFDAAIYVVQYISEKYLNRGCNQSV